MMNDNNNNNNTVEDIYVPRKSTCFECNSEKFYNTSADEHIN